MNRSVFLAVAAVLAIVVACVAGGADQVIIYQGSLVDQTGKSISEGLHKLVFSLYDRQEDGELLWTDTLLAEVGKTGTVEVTLGPIGTSLFTGDDASPSQFLEVTVDDKTVISPRTQIESEGSSSAARRLSVTEALDTTGDTMQYNP